MAKTRREQIRQETTNQIKAVARQQMRAVGATGISLRAIAREMGMTAPALYGYFPNYEALITALIVDAYNALADAMQTAKDSQDPQDFGGQYFAVTHAYRAWALQFPQDYLLINGNPIANYEAPMAVTGPPAKRSWSIFLSIMNAAMQAGQLDLPDTKTEEMAVYEKMVQELRDNFGIVTTTPIIHATVAVLATCHGMVSLQLYNRFPKIMETAYTLELEALHKRFGIPPPLHT